MLWSKVSKALDKSRYTAMEVSLFFVEFSISDVNSVKALIVE